MGKYLNCVSGISTVRKVFILCKVFIRSAAVTLLTRRVTMANFIENLYKFCTKDSTQSVIVTGSQQQQTAASN